LFVGGSQLYHRCAAPVASRDRRRTSEVTRAIFDDYWSSS
jgi:hypothetical protein